MKRIILLALLPSAVFAGGNHTTINSYAHITEEVTYESYSGIALGIATAQHHFDLGTPKTQLSIGAGSYDGANAVSIGAAKRIGDSVLLNGTLGKEGGNTGVGAGVTLRF
jgi:autotransporter adhesin